MARCLPNKLSLQQLCGIKLYFSIGELSHQYWYFHLLASLVIIDSHRLIWRVCFCEVSKAKALVANALIDGQEPEDVLKIIAAGAGHWSPFPKTQFTIVWG